MRWDGVADIVGHPLIVALLLAIASFVAARIRNRMRIAKQVRDDLTVIKAALLGTKGNEEYGELPRRGLVERMMALENEFVSDGNGSMRTLVETVARGVANLEDGEEDFRAVWLHNVQQAESHGIDGLRHPKEFKPVVRNNIHFRPKGSSLE